MSNQFDFGEWSKAANLSKEVVNALTRENLTDRRSLSVLARNPEDIKDLNLPVGDRIHLKAALEGVHHPKGRAGTQYENVDITRTMTHQTAFVTPDSSYVEPLAWLQANKVEQDDLDYVNMSGNTSKVSSNRNTGPWFHGEMSREESEKILRDHGHHRTFIIRQRPSAADAYALSVFHNGKVTHFPIVKNAQGFNIGMYDHPDLTSVVTYYTHQPITIDATEEIRLGSPLSDSTKH